MVKRKPDTPTVMVKSYRERYGYNEEDDQYKLVVSVDYWKRRDIAEQNYQLGSDNIYKDCAHKEPLLAFKTNPARNAMISYSKRGLGNRRSTASWTPKQQTPTQKFCKRLANSSHLATRNRRSD
ncbi:MAG TPA: hypothetical protein VFD48_14365 [Pyrinomonadaceae bacterium]|nr:hypothetical protein [Pyrinomonadaceae bacterium]